MIRLLRSILQRPEAPIPARGYKGPKGRNGFGTPAASAAAPAVTPVRHYFEAERLAVRRLASGRSVAAGPA